MTQHTPGPWTVPVYEGDEDSTGFKPFGSCGCCGGYMFYAPDGTPTDEEDAVMAANARLVQAAPQMYDMLERLTFDEEVKAVLSDGLYHDILSFIDSMEKATE